MSKKRPSPKSTYRIQNWPEYNQALKQHGSLTVWFSEETLDQWNYTGPPQRGAQYKYSGDREGSSLDSLVQQRRFHSSVTFSQSSAPPPPPIDQTVPV